MSIRHIRKSTQATLARAPRLFRVGLLALAPAFPAMAQLTTLQKLPPAAIAPVPTTTVRPVATPISPTLTTAAGPAPVVTTVQPLPTATISPTIAVTIKPAPTVTTIQPLPTTTISPTVAATIKPAPTVSTIQPLPTATLSPTLTTTIKPAPTVTTVQPLPTATISPTLTTTIRPAPTVTAIQPLPTAAISPTVAVTINPTAPLAAIQPLPAATLAPALTATINATTPATVQPSGVPTPALVSLQTTTIPLAVLSPAVPGLTGIGTSTILPAATAPSAPAPAPTRIVEPVPSDVAAGGLGALVAPGAGKGELVGAAVQRGKIGTRETMTLDLYGDQLVSFAVSDAVAEQISRAVGAGGGQVVLSAGAAKVVVDNVVNLGGKSRADVVVKVGDRLVLGSSEELAASDMRVSSFVDLAANVRTFTTAAGGTTATEAGLARGPIDWSEVAADANLPFALGGRFSGAGVSTLGPMAFDAGVLAPRMLHTPPSGWSPPAGGATVMYSIHRPGGSGGEGGVPGNLNPGPGSPFPPGMNVSHAATHRPGGSGGVPDAGAAVAGLGVGSVADSVAAGQPGFGGIGQGAGRMVVALTEIIPSAFDLSDEASPAQFVLTSGPGQADRSLGISGGRGVASIADLGRGSQAGDDAFSGRQHVVEAPACNSQFAGNTYFTRDVFGRELVRVCTLASAAAVSSR